MTKKGATAYGPNGELKFVVCYDNGGETFDRYTVVFKYMKNGHYNYRGMSEHPFHPQGFAMWGEHARHKGWGNVGKMIAFDELPPDCQRCIRLDYAEIWGPFQGVTNGAV